MLISPEHSPPENLQPQGESRGSRPPVVSPEPAPPEKQGVGIIKLGEVSTLAAWKSRDGEIEITFDTAKLSPARVRDLERYRLSSSPIEVCLTGEAKPFSCVMKAFDRKAARATFYLTKAVQR
jgi:hypothetical protein